MFTMTVEKQMNLSERTLLLGRPKFNIIPKQIIFKEKVMDVIGISNGIALPFVSLEVERIKDNIVGETIRSNN